MVVQHWINLMIWFTVSITLTHAIGCKMSALPQTRQLQTNQAATCRSTIYARGVHPQNHFSQSWQFSDWSFDILYTQLKSWHKTNAVLCWHAGTQCKSEGTVQQTSAQRLRRWSNSVQILYIYFVFTERGRSAVRLAIIYHWLRYPSLHWVRNAQYMYLAFLIECIYYRSFIYFRYFINSHVIPYKLFNTQISFYYYKAYTNIGP